MIRALVFDFDGLILDTESALIEAYADVHASHGQAFDRKAFMESVGHADYAFDPWHVFEKRADRAALEIERRKLNRVLNDVLPILPGVVPLLDGAAAAGLKLGVASNSLHSHVDNQLKRLGLFSRFQFIACREDVRQPKPEPEIYRFATAGLGVRPSEAVALEDSNTGITAAHRAGLRTVAVPGPSTRHHDFSKADWKVKSLVEVTVPALSFRFKI
jgi:putative hydrolase of the HAD superfamily